jgi:hypothetical protein
MYIDFDRWSRRGKMHLRASPIVTREQLVNHRVYKSIKKLGSMLAFSNHFQSLINARRQFCILNPRLFPNQPSHYTFVLSCTFALGTLFLPCVLPPLYWLIGYTQYLLCNWIDFPKCNKDWEFEISNGERFF